MKMFDAITPAAIIADATTFVATISPIVLVVIGFGVALLLANWVVSKFRRR
jgi:uncharacterized membrane protein YdbT with pleckstrin-like domain